ncbi:hypothetical protein KIW84_065328 [Lathyrus oleraceus]|uniref:Uncharacterized protein n=1 Tax=Pisum sativum TaxID=3888 RepID=A0A9D4WGT3_PEA|nr:hypothetical protein KIW84_065328 [Pisum sativum]
MPPRVVRLRREINFIGIEFTEGTKGENQRARNTSVICIRGSITSLAFAMNLHAELATLVPLPTPFLDKDACHKLGDNIVAQVNEVHETDDDYDDMKRGAPETSTHTHTTHDPFDTFTTEGKHFRLHIRSYNHVLSFTLIGVHVDENILSSGRGIYTFRAQGAFYHNIGGLYPNEGVRPCFLQLYIYDTDNELHNRMQENPQLHQNVVHKLQKMLHQLNPFVIRFKQLSLLPNISEYSIILKECQSNHHQYNLPTAKQVAEIIVGCDADSMEYERDINVIRHDGTLKKVQETKGYYDPL